MDGHDARSDDWRTELRAQGRTLRWLASQTGTPPRTVYAYSQRTRTAPAAWLAKAYAALGLERAA